jgi:hypothetical protein
LIELIRKGEKLEITPTKCGHMIYAEDDIIEKVLQMEKEQIVNSWNFSRRYIDYPADGEKYYNETYNQP